MSGVPLFEEGKPLGPPRSLHAHIREQGGGRYSHWTRETLYFSASDSTDPRTNGRRYEVASRNPRSTLGGLDRFPATAKRHVEEITSSRHEYTVEMGGTLDKVHRVHISEVPGLPITPAHDGMVEATILPDDLLEEIRAEIPFDEAYYYRLLAAPGKEIIKAADKWDADLIIVYHNQHRDINEVFSRSCAQRVAEHANCSVLWLRQVQS